MERQEPLPYPYEFTPIKPEEQAEMDQLYDSLTKLKCFRVGPTGYFVYEPFKDDAANIYNMPLRSTDTFVVTYQRSGTTLAQELVWLVANNLDYDTAAKIPLLQRYPFLDSFMFSDETRRNLLEEIFKGVNNDLAPIVSLAKQTMIMLSTPATRVVADMPSPRFIKSHLPLSLLNPKLLDTAKVVYVARDPRDVAVSCYHHTKLLRLMQYPGGFKQFWYMFQRGLFTLQPSIEHVKEAWHQRHHPNMLFLFYEELSKDLPTAIRRVAKFLGKELNPEQFDKLCDHLSIDKFRKNAAINYEELRLPGLLAQDETFIRKGKVGGWREYFDEEMTQQAERWMQEGLKDTDLRFPEV